MVGVSQRPANLHLASAAEARGPRQFWNCFAGLASTECKRVGGPLQELPDLGSHLALHHRCLWRRWCSRRLGLPWTAVTVDGLSVVARATTGILRAGTGAGLYVVEASTGVARTVFCYDLARRLLGSSTEISRRDSPATVRQRTVVYDNRWFYPIDPANADSDSAQEWIEVEGSGYASTALSVVYRLRGAVSVEEAGTGVYRAHVSLAESAAASDIIDRSAVIEAATQLGFTESLDVDVTVSPSGDLATARHGSKQAPDVAVTTTFRDLGVPQAFPPEPVASEKYRAAELFARLESGQHPFRE